MTNEGTSVITFNVHPQTNYETLSIMPGNFLFCSDVRTFGCRLHAALWWPGCLFGVRHLVKSCGGFHWWDTVKPYHLPSFLLNDEQKDEQKDDRPKWQKYGIFASPKNLVPESINIQKLSTSTGSYDPLKRRRAACALWQHRGFCSLWGRCLQGRAQERGHIEQLKPRVRHEACIFLQLLVKCAGSFCWAWLFPSGAGGPPRNRYQHLWCTQCGNHQGVTPGCQINVSFDHRVSKNSGVSERVGIDCSCFSLGDHHFSTRTCAEKMLWLRAISNVKATQSKPLRFCQDSPIWYRL